ncbi:MAG TPA: glycosyltransferase family 2 protein [Chitinispirillaceae bacterium]|nr:glycosyltransferase family 2 protein [Chitinispirillaceae bacterium]
MVVIYVFWFSVFLAFFSYFGYPVTLILVSAVSRKMFLREPVTPSVSLIITAYNEEKRIREKLENTMKLDYPKELLQIIVASDGSTDKTHDIVREYEDRGVELFIVQDRKGKENAQAQAVKIARGDIVVFSDTATRLDPQGIREIVSNFADPSIGCVSSEDKMISDDSSDVGGEGFYVKYEMWLRKLESRINSVVGLSGSFFAARREVCNDFSPKMQSDFRTLLSSMKKGLRGVSDPNAIGYYQDIKDKSREFHRKVRTVLRGLTVFFNHLEFLNFFQFGFFSYQYFCHKLMRWLVPVFLLTAFVSGGVLMAHSGFYRILFALQAAFYVLAFAGILLPALTRIVFIKIPSFFVVVNASIFVAWLKFFKGERVTHWQPSIR